MGNTANIIFCGASMGMTDEDEEEDPRGQPPQIDNGGQASAEAVSKEESEQAFISEFTTVLSDGLNVRLHDATSARKRILQLERDGETVVWNIKSSRLSKEKPHEEDVSFKISEISNITRGSFPGKAISGKKCLRCFTVTTKRKRVYQIETKDNESRDILADGFELIMTRVLDPTRI